MGLSLIENFREKMNKSKVKGASDEATFDVAYSTGFLSIDYLNGTTIYVNGNDRNFQYVSAGVTDGSCLAVWGRTGSGKSTLTTQIASNIMMPFVNNNMPTALFIDDIEGSLPFARREYLLGLDADQIDKYVIVRNSGITTENVYERIKEIYEDKIAHKKDYEYDTGLFDIYGNRVYKFIPTIYIIDSLPMLLPEEMADESELGGSMSASSIAKTNTMLLKKIAQLCKAANIIFITINHIMDDIQMGFIPKAALVSGLKQGERVSGGRIAIAMQNNVFRIDDSTTLKPSDGFGIDGSIVNLTMIKSRSNTTKKSVPLIFNKTEGKFDELLSLFQLLKSEGRIQGAGAYLYLKETPDIKFSQKNFKSVLADNVDLQRSFAKECHSILVGYLSTTKNASKESNSTTTAISDLFRSFDEEELNSELEKEKTNNK